MTNLELFDLALGLTGLPAAIYAITVTARSMRRKWHGLALWVLSVGYGAHCLSLIFLPAGSAEDVAVTHTGDALMGVGFWLIILTRHWDDKQKGKKA